MPSDLRSRGHKNKNEITKANTSKYLNPRNGYRPRSKSDRAIVRWMLLSAVGDCDCRVLHLSGRLCWCCCIWSQGLAASKLIKRVFASLISSLLPVVLFPLLNTELPVCSQLLRLMATASQLGGLMSQAFISRVRTSLFRRCGLPGGLEPVASSH